MGYQLSTESLEKLQSVHGDLVKVVQAVSQIVPVSVICGYRDEASQALAVAQGRSKTPWPHSKHNLSPALAVDLTPLPFRPSNTDRMYYFAGLVLGVATQLGIPIRCGADFDCNFDPDTDSFHDLFHFELKKLVVMPVA
jgi:hypothetical protein